MTIVNKNSTIHSGLLVTGTGDDIDIDVELIGGRTLRMSASGDELGAWPIDDCHIEPDPDRNGTFRIVVDGDDAVFTPSDPVGFRSLIEFVTGPGPDEVRPPELPSEPLAAAVDPVVPVSAPDTVHAADDPVAFLFGSSPPPPPPNVDERADAMLTVPAVEPDPVDPDPVDFDWDELDEIEVTIEPVSAHSTPPIEMDTEDDDPPIAVDDPAPDVSPTLAARLEEAERIEAESDEDIAESEASMVAVTTADALDADDAAIARSRFGGSALDRLSEAISSVTSSSSSSIEDDYDLEPNNVADEVLTSQRTLRDYRLKDAKRTHRVKMAAIGGVVVGLIALIALLAPGAIAFIQHYEGDAAPPPTLPVTETTVVTTTTTVSEETTVDSSTSTTLAGSPDGSVFALSAPEFVARWDAAAGIVDEVLEFDSNPIVGPFEEQFTPYLSFIGEVQPNGSLNAFSLVVDPSGPSEYDRIGIQALGVAVATVDPERSPQGRADLLGEMGLNVRDPQLGGIDGSVQSDGVQFALVYDSETALLTLTVTPVG
ncbi:MAG: hypothetical protein WD156_08600 [Acidimicrobiia bacterium]